MKAYKIDTTKYTDEQVLELAIAKGYPVMENKEVQLETGQVEMKLVETSRDRKVLENFISDRFKEMADAWFAETLIEQALREVETTKNEAIKNIKQQISTTTTVTDIK